MWAVVSNPSKTSYHHWTFKMAILDTSSLTTYAVSTLTNSSAVQDLVTGPLNPSSYSDPMLGNVSLSNAVNFDPKAAGLDLVGAPRE